jgi:N-acylneuraminate cytidylyltransferase
VNIAIIPARGGSKRIPHKNIKEFCGKPMIAWSIQTALESGCFERVLVSTDDPEISEVAQAHGAEVPFMRPTELSDDYTGTIPVISHAIRWQANHGMPATQVCCLYATAPFVQAEDLQRGLELLQHSGADFALSVTSFAFPIQRAVRITSEQRVEMFQPEHSNTRSQDLEEAWHDAGQFYWGHAAVWLDQKPFFAHQVMPVRIPRHLVQDIDTPEDWTRAEWMYRSWKSLS